MTPRESGEFKQLASHSQDAARLSRAMEASELDRRTTVLESSVQKLENNLLERHAKLITIIFSCMTVFVGVCAILVTLLGWFSKSDTRDATKDMESKVEKKMTEIDAKFQLLAGEALKKPVLELLHDGVPLENRLVEVFGQMNVSPLQTSLDTLFLRNVGEKRTEPLSIRISTTLPFQMGWDSREWERVPSFDKEYAVSFSSTRHTTVAPRETLTIHPLVINWDYVDASSNVLCKLEVFYGGEKSAEARFRIKLTPR